MSSSVLDPSAVLSSLVNFLPVSSKILRSPHDALAALLHTAMVAVGFRLIAVDDSSPPNTNSVNVLPTEWNKHSPSHFAFRYRHEQSSLDFIVKVVKLGSRTMVNAIASESEKAATLDISTNDFTSSSFYPYDASSPEAQPLVHGFISSNRVSDFLSQFKGQIIQKLIPGLNKPGYQEDVDHTHASGSRAEVPRSTPLDARPQPPPRVPALYQHIPPSNPLEIGRRDLDPIPRNPFGPPSLFPGNDPDGMFVGPNHPIFGAAGRNSDTRGPWGGDGFLPPMGAPPGARFDPVGPGLGPFPGRGNPLGGRGRGSAGGHNAPDNDEFMPPGAGDMYM